MSSRPKTVIPVLETFHRLLSSPGYMATPHIDHICWLGRLRLCAASFDVGAGDTNFTHRPLFPLAPRRRDLPRQHRDPLSADSLYTIDSWTFRAAVKE